MIEPIYFYIGVVFVLQAVHVTALFVSSWIMSGTWIAGMLSVAWYIVNRYERVPDSLENCSSVPLNWPIGTHILFKLISAPLCFRADASKIEYAIPLRDNWALPYFSCQVAALTGFLRNNINSSTEVSLHIILLYKTATGSSYNSMFGN